MARNDDSVLGVGQDADEEKIQSDDKRLDLTVLVTTADGRGVGN